MYVVCYPISSEFYACKPVFYITCKFFHSFAEYGLICVLKSAAYNCGSGFWRYYLHPILTILKPHKIFRWKTRSFPNIFFLCLM